MPIPEQRDLEETRGVLGEWMAQRLTDATEIEISDLTIPEGTGFSNETLMFDASWNEDGQRCSDSLVLRVEPTGYQIFLEANFENQYRVLERLDRHTDVPVPPMRWYEPDPSVLGSAFFVMAKVSGEAASDDPNYNSAGWLAQATPDQRRTAWLDGMDALCRIHCVPTSDVAFLDDPERGPTGFDQQLRYWEESFEWAARDRPHPVTEAAWGWLQANLPPERPTGLAWGDARIGNVLFDDHRAGAVVDWEMVSLGGHIADLGWWLFLDAFHAADVPRLDGLGTREETIEFWEDRTGEKTADLEWYEVFAGFRFSVIMMRLAQMFESWGVERDQLGDMETDNPVTHLLARMLDVPPPGS